MRFDNSVGIPKREAQDLQTSMSGKKMHRFLPPLISCTSFFEKSLESLRGESRKESECLLEAIEKSSIAVQESQVVRN